jgi:cathepsin B
MKLIILAGIILLGVMARHPVNEEIVNQIKAEASWTPMEVDENPFAYWSEDEIKSMLGTKLLTPEQIENDDNVIFEDGSDLEDYPLNFDSREEWPDFIHPIRNQGHCGSCWAFGAAEAFSDRYTIASKGDFQEIFSPQDLVDCSAQNYGCNGGFVNKAWDYIHIVGAITDDCKHYTSGDDGKTHKCVKACDDSDTEYVRYKAGKKQHATTTKGGRGMIMRNGPVEGAFTVYEDFMSYSSGVYQHKTGKKLGGHAIKILGWGKEDDLYYWLCANSWGPEWGDNGYFKIQMGQVGINTQMYAGIPVVTEVEKVSE